MKFEKGIQQWVSIDNQLKILHEKTSELREAKSELSKNIFGYADKNNLRNSIINISDGRLKFINTNVATPLTFKYVEKSLGEIIEDENQVKKIMDYLKKNRDIKTVAEIKRYSTN